MLESPLDHCIPYLQPHIIFLRLILLEYFVHYHSTAICVYFNGITHTPVISIFTLPEYIAIDVPCTNMDLIVASISNSIHVIGKQAHSLHMKSVAEIKVFLLYSDTISLWNRTPPGVFPAFLVTTYSMHGFHAWRLATTKTT